MLGEDYEEEFESNQKDLFKIKSNNNSNYHNNQNDYLEYSTNKSKERKKERTKKHKKKSACENCKALNQKINELEQLNEELLKIKEKLSNLNDELSLKNEELLQNNINIINKNKELLSTNKQLKEENNELINKNKELIEEKNEYKAEIDGLKKQLIKVNELNSVSKEKEKDNSTKINNDININDNQDNKNIVNNDNIQNNNDKEDNKNNVNNDNISNNNDIKSNNNNSISPKKEEIINNNIIKSDIIIETKYCTMDDYNALKTIVNELKEKVNNLEKWKKNFGTGEKLKKKPKENKNIFEEYNNSIKHNSIRQNDNNNINKKINDNNDIKISKSFLIEQKIKNIYNSETNSKNNIEGLNFNFDHNNNINKKIEINHKINKAFNKIEKEKINNLKKNKEIEKIKNKNQRFNSKIITNVEDLDLIARGLVKDDIDSLKNLRVGYKLIFRASDHGDEAEDFHEKCDDIEGTLTIIKTKEGNIFGGYTSLSWDPEEEAEKKDEDAFTFSLNLEKIFFESGEKDYSIFCDKNKGPCFVGMFAIQEHIFNSKSYVNPWGIQCFSGENSNYEINQGKNEFFIEELEVFQVIVKRN